MIDNFFKFPSTPHLAVLGDAVIREDKVFSTDARLSFLENEIIVEEKIDGANLGISFNGNGEILLQNRGALLLPPYYGQWKKIPEWLNRKTDNLFDVLHDQYILFGEWCYAKHSILYNKLPDWFLGFDVFDKQAGRFLSCQRRDELFRQLHIFSVPFIHQGVFTLELLNELFTTAKYGTGPSEGIYLRHDDEQWLRQRCKLVRPEFVQTIESHWSSQEIVPNRLRQI